MEFLGKTVAAAIGMVLCLSTQAQSTQNSALVWESKNGAPKGIYTELVAFYEALRELRSSGDTLLTRTAILQDESGGSILSLVADERLFPTDLGSIPQSLDLLLCELNPNKCTVRVKKRKPTAYWGRVHAEEVVIPDMRLSPSEQVQTYEKKKGDRISSIVVTDRMGCIQYNAYCEAKLKHLNIDPKVLEVNSAGTIYVPSISFSTRVPVKPGVASEIGNGGISERLGVSKSAADQFVRNVIQAPTSVKANSESGGGSSLGLAKSEILKLIGYKRIAETEDRFISIGLIDSIPDLKHCEFDLKLVASKGQVVNYEDGKPFDASRFAPDKKTDRCGELSNLEVTEIEHGTHLLGIWFARKQAKSGEGMLPLGDLTRIGLAEVSYPKLTQGEHYRRAGEAMRRMSSSLRVINVSWGVSAGAALDGGGDPRPQNDTVGEAIMKVGKAGKNAPVLFVAAAGDGRGPLKVGSCDITPLCGPSDRVNVLSVTALTNDGRDPDIAGSSNYGKVVDIGVPAVGVLSLLRNNLTARGSGTSQAAAIASGAASMLMFGTGIKPEQARNRLIYSSDLTPKLQSGGGKLFGGRLNFSRASEMNKDWVKFRGGVEALADVDFSAATFDFINAESRTAIKTIPVSKIKRLFKNGTADPTRPYTVFFMEGNPALLTRIDGELARKSLNSAVRVSKPNEGSLEGRVSEVLDYTARRPTND